MTVKYAADPIRVIPMSCSNMIIHFPGFGINRVRAGKKAARMKGNASPSPMEKKTAICAEILCVSDHARTDPRKGPVQGVARIAARNPFEKESNRKERFLEEADVRREEGNCTVYTPKSERAMEKRTSITMMRNRLL